MASPKPREGPQSAGGNSAAVDFVYLKNVLLQFLEQKDRKYQMQLMPVLGTLLHFDRCVRPDDFTESIFAESIMQKRRAAMDDGDQLALSWCCFLDPPVSNHL